MKTLMCKRCGYKWLPRIKTPKRCPGCKSPYWNTTRKVKSDGKATDSDN